jgi:hypothetical protein
MSEYDYRFDFDGGVTDEQGNYVPDPPNVYIVKDGFDFLKVYEEAEEIEGTPILDEKGHANHAHWKLGPEATEVLNALKSVKSLKMKNALMASQLQAQYDARRRRYQDEHDYLPYAEDDRD